MTEEECPLDNFEDIVKGLSDCEFSEDESEEIQESQGSQHIVGMLKCSNVVLHKTREEAGSWIDLVHHKHNGKESTMEGIGCKAKEGKTEAMITEK